MKKPHRVSFALSLYDLNLTPSTHSSLKPAPKQAGFSPRKASGYNKGANNGIFPDTFHKNARNRPVDEIQKR